MMTQGQPLSWWHKVSFVLLLAAVSMMFVTRQVRIIRHGIFLIADRVYYGQYLPLATGDERVDRLLKAYENETRDMITFPIIVLTPSEFTDRFYKQGPVWPFKNQDIRTFSDLSEVFVGVCVVGPFYRRAIYLNAHFIDSFEISDGHREAARDHQDSDVDRFLAKTLAHELGHCRHFLDHSEDLTSIMYEDVSMSLTPGEQSSVASFLKGSTRAKGPL